MASTPPQDIDMSSPESSPDARASDASSQSNSAGTTQPAGTAKPKSKLPNGVRKCRFNDCDNAAVDGTSKCAFHKNRRQCCVENCTNQVYARKLCVRHGGKKQCQADNCEAHARGGGYCLQHGGFVVKRFCIVEGCSKQAHARQKCVRHGGGRRCKVDGCMQHARAGGLCNRHSHGHQCRIEGCKKTAQHSGSICFRHAMELRAHGEQVPELNISKGGRLSSKKRQQLQREQQLKQEQFHHHQLQQQQHQQQQQQMQHQGAPLSVTVPGVAQPNQAAPATPSTPGPFGLPLKINVPNNIPKFSGLKTPLGGFPTPRSHEFSLLMGLPSPQIDHSQLPSVLAMANQQRSLFDSANSLPSGLLSGPPSVSRGRGTPGSSFLTLGVFPTGDKPTPHGSHMEEDLDAIINGYKFTGGASPIAYTPQMQQFAPTPTMLENIGANMFDQSGHGGPNNNNMNMRNHLGLNTPSGNGGPQFNRLITPTHGLANGAGPFEGFATPHLEGSHDYTAQFFADNQASAAEKARAGVKVGATTTPKAGVAAA